MIGSATRCSAGWTGRSGTPCSSSWRGGSRRVPELFAVAAEQYMPVVDAVEAAGERHQVVDLLKRAADQATLIGDHALVSGLMTAALRLLEAGDEADLLVEVHTARHAALVSLGRFDEADEDYRAIEAAAPRRPAAPGCRRRCRCAASPTEDVWRRRTSWASARCASAASTFRAPTELPAELDRQLETLFRWLNETGDADDLAMPDVTDPRLLTAGRLLDAMLAPTFFSRRPPHVRVGVPGGAADLGRARAGADADGHRRERGLSVRGRARGLRRRVPGGAPDPRARRSPRIRARDVARPERVLPRQLLVRADRERRRGVPAGARGPDRGRRPRQRRLHAPRDRHAVCSTAGRRWTSSSPRSRRGWRSSDAPAASRPGCGSTSTSGWSGSCAARSRAAGEAAPTSRHAGNPLALNHVYVTRAVAAAIFGDAESLARHTAVAVAGLHRGRLVGQRRWPTRSAGWRWPGSCASPPATTATLLRELDVVMPWLAARAADAPDNFLHLLHLVEAELAWTRGDFHAAAVAFDAALREVASPAPVAPSTHRRARGALLSRSRAGARRLRPPRAGAPELSRVGRDGEGRPARLVAPELPPVAEVAETQRARAGRRVLGRSSTVTTGTVDLVGILSASQALSSETELERLQPRLVES